MGPQLPSPYSHVRVVHDFFLASFPSPSPSKGRHEDITRDYFEAKKRYEGIMESLKNLKRYNRVSFPPELYSFPLQEKLIPEVINM